MVLQVDDEININEDKAMSGEMIDLQGEVNRLIEEAKKNKSPVLNLSRKGLNEIPQEVFNLIYLERLDLYNNNIHFIPPEISKLLNLKKLYLSDNRLTTLPSEIGKLTKLEYISVIENPLLTLPKEIADLKNLKGIYVDDDEVLRTVSHFKDWVINTIPVPEELRVAIKQYLVFFTEYVLAAKNEEIKFEVRTIPNGLEIHTRPENELEYEKTIEYLREYLELLQKNVDEITAPTSDRSNEEILMFMVDLKNQLRFFQMSLERKEVEKLMMDREMERVYKLLERKFDQPLQLTTVSTQTVQQNLVSANGSSEALSTFFIEILSLLKESSSGLNDPDIKKEAKDLEEELSQKSTNVSSKEAESLLHKIHMFLKKAKKIEGVSGDTIALFSRLASKVTEALEFLTTNIF